MSRFLATCASGMLAGGAYLAAVSDWHAAAAFAFVAAALFVARYS